MISIIKNSSNREFSSRFINHKENIEFQSYLKLVLNIEFYESSLIKITNISNKDIIRICTN